MSKKKFKRLKKAMKMRIKEFKRTNPHLIITSIGPVSAFKTSELHFECYVHFTRKNEACETSVLLRTDDPRWKRDYKY